MNEVGSLTMYRLFAQRPMKGASTRSLELGENRRGARNEGLQA